MKRILVFALSLMMMLSCASAMAEAVYFDPAAMEIIPGEFAALEGIGLMFYLPETMQPIEMTEADVAGGGLAAFTDGTVNVSIAYAPIADDAGNPLCTIDEVVEFYNASGIAANAGVLNDLGCVAFTVPETSLGGVVFPDGEGGLLAFSFAPLNETAAVMLSSIMACEE